MPNELKNPGCLARDYLINIVAFDAIVQIAVYLEYIMQLQQLKKIHNLTVNIADFEMSIINIGCFHNRQKNAET